jgi:hypothetical protein
VCGLRHPSLRSELHQLTPRSFRIERRDVAVGVREINRVAECEDFADFDVGFVSNFFTYCFLLIFVLGNLRYLNEPISCFFDFT